jgi:Asp-tRNA(Asn)/Glu-tRNA(Gln) amidotransferase A subunit family amidase
MVSQSGVEDHHRVVTWQTGIAGKGTLMDVASLSARTAGQMIRAGELSAGNLMDACLARIAARDADVRAWSFLDFDLARERARLADAWQAAKLPLGPLHGLPIGIKDVFDTCDMPSEYGSALFRGRQPDTDAAAVAVLRRSGAIIVGKTATSEFGMYHPSQTRNPRDLERSPGVSSAGSAAAVVDHMVPLALGTQHTASTTLPASFCGAVAFKPSFGFTSMEGSNILVPRLAHLGFFARSVDDLGLFAGIFDPALSHISPTAYPPRLAYVHGPGWETTNDAARSAFASFVEGLGPSVPDIDLPGCFDDALEVTVGLLNAHLAYRFGGLPEAVLARLCQPLQDGVAVGRQLSAARCLEFDAAADLLAASADALFDDHDALVTLSTPTEATLLADGPGSGIMSMPWSLCGLPTVSLPLLGTPRGLPIGVQVIGRRNGDRNLLRVAAWLADTCGHPSRKQILD